MESVATATSIRTRVRWSRVVMAMTKMTLARVRSVLTVT
jgi:hypothetical protein